MGTETHADLTAILEHGLDAVFLTRPDATILYANPAACRLFGFTLSELRQLGRGAVMDPDDPALPAALAERQRTGQFRGMLRMRRKDGSIFAAEVSSAIFHDDAGGAQTSTFVRDVSDRIAREQALQQTNDELRQALAEVRELRGILPICSHCKRIRNDADYWQHVESYIAEHTPAEFSHGICPACLAEHYPPE